MNSKIFNDPIHGHIEVSAICVKIIDTPQYQRLRDVGQLGGLYYVFAGASSNRFEHCIGVSHLAKNFVSQLHATQPELNITKADILCVEMAGLLHDLGHGPFSHLFDMKFLRQMGTAPPGFEHEHASIGIFDLLIRENDLLPEFRKHGLTEADIHFVKELILGGSEEAPPGFQWVGRGDKTFLYDIVANKRNGIDVDKFDYFARDCHVLGLTKSFDCSRLMKFARVLRVARSADGEGGGHACAATGSTGAAAAAVDAGAGDGQLEICFHIKEAWNLFELFHTRYALHKRAYQHKVSTAVELMICESLVLADPFVFVPGHDDVPTRMSQTPHDMTAYWKCSDYIWKTIQFSTMPELKPARDIIQRINRRDLWACAGESLLSPRYARHLSVMGWKAATAQIKEQLVDIIVAAAAKNKSSNKANTTVDELICSTVKMGFGKGGKNPVSELTTFFVPEKTSDSGASSKRTAADGMVVGVAPPDSVSRLLPREFEETYLRIYCKRKADVPAVHIAFETWCKVQLKLFQDNGAGGESSSSGAAPVTITTPTRKRLKTDSN